MPETNDGNRASLPWRRHLIIALILVTGAAAAGRSHLRKEREARQEAARQERSQPAATGFMPQKAPPPPEEEPSPAEKTLPFVTEAGLAMLIGLGLGLATRSILRLLIIMFAVGFLTLQFLGYKGWIDPDWSGTVAWFQNFVLHISNEADWRGVVQHKTPTAAAFVIGYLLGLKKG